MSDFDVSISNDLCTMCEECIDACNENIFALSDEMKIIVQNEDDCNGCQDCTEICLPGAISVSESLSAMKERHEKERALRKKRITEFNKAIDRIGPNEHGEFFIPVKELLEALEFSNMEQLENWLMSSMDYIALIDDDYVNVTQME